ncbi:hypothetical protein K493DRAFT_386280 [Basidiobolus meristosporus CBS 931.73]|uniref:Uncharacterized protein n=1 Tax=Basidiobolus meristosporus CBS 931.73 TaxID=1314790 RepID=A0A1Y1XLK2_9FUNG|nr:hypothetical protein K493DRAFT_386280 [Basidiobolus meristosporus CBS 931.73]|eukprot:ORX86628.1 hypothetical protein K493DRAFT_386280 [Basidiobolus meristosporus CBS 931.73]
MSFLSSALRPLTPATARFVSGRVGVSLLTHHTNSLHLEYQQQRGYAKKKGGKGKKGEEQESASDAPAAPEFDLSKFEAKFADSVEALKREFNSMRIGRANPGT